MKHFKHAIVAGVFGIALAATGSSALAQASKEWTQQSMDTKGNFYPTCRLLRVQAS